MKKSYYAIIPANVRYDNKLKPNAKLLYGEITALANEKGYCWASNNYFAELYGVSKETVSRWINNLENKGYIYTQLIYKEVSKEIKERRIYIAPIDNFVNTPCQNDQYPIDKKINTPIDEKIKDNNTLPNTTVNNTRDIELQKDCNDNLKFTEESTEIALARYMINEMLRVKSDSKVPDSDAKSLQSWAQHIDYMIRLDKREPRQIAELFKWTQNHDFWVANIRSPRKLREKWDTLELQKNRNKPKGNNNISKLEEMYQEALAEEEGGSI